MRKILLNYSSGVFLMYLIGHVELNPFAKAKYPQLMRLLLVLLKIFLLIQGFIQNAGEFKSML